MELPIDEFTNHAKEINRSIIQSCTLGPSMTTSCKNKLYHIKKKYKSKFYSLLLYKLTNLYFETRQAKILWHRIIKHRESLMDKLNRDIDIEVATLDFFIVYKNDLLENPLIIEEKIFENIKNRILIDDLTGLFNYRYYKQRIREEISKAKRYHHPFSLIMLDIDNFKLYNDMYGHLEGNKVLTQIALELKIILRSSDIIIRFGGEEFLIILPQTTKKEALLVGEKIIHRIATLKFKRKITASGGVATYLHDTKSTENSLMQYADSALYRAKYEGKNRICNYPKERRVFKRIPITENINFSAKIIKHNSKLKHVKNISKSGISIYLNKKLEKNTIIEGTLEKDKKSIKFIGQIVWCSTVDKNLFEAGIKFLDASQKKVKNLILEKS